MSKDTRQPYAAPLTLRIMAEYAGSGLWVIESHGAFRHGMVTAHRLGLTLSLEQALDQWIALYHACQSPDFNTCAFNQEGRRLASEVKRQLGSRARVFFIAEKEDGSPGDEEEIPEPL